MSRHQRNHVKRNTRFGKYKNADSTEGEENNDGMSSPNLMDDGSGDDALAELGASESEQEAALLELLGDGDDISEEEATIDSSKVNLDITAMIAYVSALTNGRNWFTFKEKILAQQVSNGN